MGQGEEFIPAYPVNAVDTTGAGDAFVAGILAAWYRGLPWSTAAQLGALVASAAVTGATRYENLRNLDEYIARARAQAESPERIGQRRKEVVTNNSVRDRRVDMELPVIFLTPTLAPRTELSDSTEDSL